MTVVRRIARPMLAAMFVSGGLDALRNPEPRVPSADSVAPSIAARLPYLPENPETLVRINGGVMLGAGTMLTLGRLPRLSAILLAGTIVPTTLAGHRFWQEEDPAKRKQQWVHFLKNLGLLGGLMLAAVDTEGQPGLVWRARHASHHAARGTRRARRAATREAKVATRRTRARLPV